MGGARTLVIKGSLKQFDPEQAHAPGGEPKHTNDSQFVLTADAATQAVRVDWTIAAARARYPGKPVAYLVLTYHHMDHAGGLRAYLAEGATLVVGQGTAAHYRRVLAAPFTRSPDLTPGDLSQARIVEVHDRQRFAGGHGSVAPYSLLEGLATLGAN